MKSSIKREVRTPKYRMRVVKSRKGKGSYKRINLLLKGE